MAGGPVGAKTKKAGSSTGENAPYMKDGYAKGPVPKSMIGTKVGKTNKKGYSGPEVQQGQFP